MQVMAGARHGGAEAFFTRLVPSLARAGLEQRAVIRRDPRRAATLRAGGIEPVELAFGAFLDLATPSRLGREIADFDPDVVLSWMSRATRSCPPGKFVHAARLGGYYDLKHYRRCDHMIANTPDIADYIVAGGWAAARVHYVPNFVAVEPGPPVDRAALNTPDDAPVLLALGRLHRNKAFDVLIEAMVEIPSAYLWLAGAGPLRRDLAARIARLGLVGRVRMLGWRDDVSALMRAADVLVCPSRHEPLGNVVIEGWAFGLPVIAAASAGPAGLIESGVNGLLVPVDDSAALGAAARQLLADESLAQQLVAGGRAAHEAEFTETAVAARYLAFFDRVGG